MKKTNKTLPLAVLLCTSILGLEANAATAVSISSPPKNYYVTSANQSAVAIEGSCAARIQVSTMATDSDKKSTSITSIICDSKSKYKMQLNLSGLKDGNIQIRVAQVVNRVTKNVYQNVIKSTVVTPAPIPTPVPAPAPAPIPPVSTTTTPDPFLTQVFSDSSPWNTPIINNPELEAKTVQMMQLVKDYSVAGGYAPTLGLAYKAWTTPLHFIDSTTAVKQSVFFDTASYGSLEGFHDSVDPTGIGEVKNVPLPMNVWPDPQGDGHMSMYDKATGLIYEFSKFRWVSGVAYATRVAIFDSTSSGIATAYNGQRWWMNGVRGSGLPVIGGLIRHSEFLSGEINHALSLAGPTNRLKKLATDTHKKELCGPMATRTDGWEIGENTILEGARIQLNPNLNLDTLGLSADAKVIARALQKYGGFMTDNAPTFNLYFENLGPANHYKWEQTGLGDLTKIPLDQFRVLKCNDIQIRN
jgi:hypothetical protein